MQPVPLAWASVLQSPKVVSIAVPLPDYPSAVLVVHNGVYQHMRRVRHAEDPGRLTRSYAKGVRHAALGTRNPYGPDARDPVHLVRSELGPFAAFLYPGCAAGGGQSGGLGEPDATGETYFVYTQGEDCERTTTGDANKENEQEKEGDEREGGKGGGEDDIAESGGVKRGDRKKGKCVEE